jgi:hypothetical protein
LPTDYEGLLAFARAAAARADEVEARLANALAREGARIKRMTIEHRRLQPRKLAA